MAPSTRYNPQILRSGQFHLMSQTPKDIPFYVQREFQPGVGPALSRPRRSYSIPMSNQRSTDSAMAIPCAGSSIHVRLPLRPAARRTSCKIRSALWKSRA